MASATRGRQRAGVQPRLTLRAAARRARRSHGDGGQGVGADDALPAAALRRAGARQFHCRGTGVLLGCQLGARWCLASSLTCDFNMIKNYTHDWLLLVAAYHASSRRWGALAPQRKTRRFTGDREFGVATASRCCNWFRNRVDSRCRDGAVTTRSSCYGYYLASRLNSGVSVD